MGMAGVVLGGTALAWVLSRRTREEQQYHEEMRKKGEELKRILQREQTRLKRDLSERGVLKLEKWVQSCRQSLEAFRQKDRLIRPDLERVENEVRHQAANSAMDSFRRRLLRRELMRYEDALLRLQAYPQYLDWYENKLNELLASETLGDVFELSTPSAVLPEFWLYPGRLIMLPAEFLGRPLPEFSHTVWLESRPSLMLQKKYFYSAEVSPVLIVEQEKGTNNFRGSALKGAFYRDHFIKNFPADFKVAAVGSEYCRGSMMEGSVWAVLLRENMADQGMRKFPGQVLRVYLDESTLLLNGNYSHRCENNGRTLPVVSELSPEVFDSETQMPLFLLMNSDEYAEDVCRAADETRTPFNLVDFRVCDEGAVVILSKNGWRFFCLVDPKGWLMLFKVDKDNELELAGISLPFLIVPAEGATVEHLLPNPEGVSRLIEHAGRLSTMEEREKAGAKAIEFFDKWNAVLNFLQDREGCRELVFHAGVSQQDGRCSLTPASCSEKEDFFRFREEYLRECAQPGKQSWTPPMYLQRWQESENWRTVCREGVFLAEEGFVEFEGGPFLPGSEGFFRLSFHTAQFAPLERQRAALASLRDDRFVSPHVRESLLLPQKEHYRPKVSEAWKRHFSSDSVWTTRPTQLSRNQKDVVCGCLSTSPLVLVQGPPGTGKTRCILEMVYQFLSVKPQAHILLSSQQNTAVDNVLDRLIDCHSDFLQKKNVRILRIGTEDKMSEPARRHTFEALKKRLVDTLKEGKTEENATPADGAEYFSGDSFGSSVPEDDSKQKLYRDFVEYITPQLLAPSQDMELLYCLSRSCQIVAGTCVGLAGRISALENCRFDLVIIDEAGRATPPELLIPIKFAEHVVLFGDHYQLPPCVDPLLREEEAKETLPFLHDAFLDESFFGSLFEALPDNARFRLSEQYRMDNDIGDLVADLFYTEHGQRMLHNGAPAGKAAGHIYWRDVDGSHEQIGTSLCNGQEISVVIKILAFFDEMCGKGKISTVAVITPYREQKKRLREAASKLRLKHLSEENVNINTVDQFQGSEADAVIYSTVRTSGKMSFLLDRKRLNVACSRARHYLIFVGRKSYFEQEGDNLFAEIIRRCRR